MNIQRILSSILIVMSKFQKASQNEDSPVGFVTDHLDETFGLMNINASQSFGSLMEVSSQIVNVITELDFQSYEAPAWRIHLVDIRCTVK